MVNMRAKKWAKNGPFNILCPFCFILNKKKLKTKIENFKNLDQKWPKNGPKMDLLTFSVHFVSFKKKKNLNKKLKI